MQFSQSLRSFAVGAATGMRSMTGPAAAARGTTLGRYLPVLALGELVVDKLPVAPARTMPAALAVRMIAGGVAGAALAGKEERALGAALGAAGALATSYGGIAYRRVAGRYVPDFVAALLEDGAAIALARAAGKAS